jgi:tetratricopeptide (TPR) repeat protein
MGSDSLLTLPALLDAALPTPSRAREVESLLAEGQVTINVIAEKLLEGRPATMQFLKQLGVDRLGERQQIVNAACKAERTGKLPQEDGKRTFRLNKSSDQFCATALLATADEIKQRGNEAFKAGSNDLAANLYGDAIRAAREASKDEDAQPEASKLLVSLHSNVAAAFLKLEQWDAAIQAASSVLEVESDHPKALYRRGVARKHLRQRGEAKEDLVRAVKLDPKNKEAREVLAAMEAEVAAEKAAAKARFREGFQKGEHAVDESKYAEESEDAIIEAWRCECDRQRTEKGRCIVELGDEPWERKEKLEDEDSKQNWKGFDLAPISLAEFKRQRKAQKAAEAAAKAAGNVEGVTEGFEPLVGGGGSPTASGEGGIGQAAAPQEAEEVVPIGAPRCSTCRKPLGHEWYTCSVCESDVCDQCPMHTDPRDEAESICQRCGPDAWDGKQV